VQVVGQADEHAALPFTRPAVAVYETVNVTSNCGVRNVRDGRFIILMLFLSQNS
jgi:hypothetical protein